jgi:F0F1-type ATP synthase membrane subunit b/b'
MAGQFLILMVFLDKFWFGPVGKVLDERDALIRSKLGSVKDNTGDVDKLAAEAQEILKASLREKAHPCRQLGSNSRATTQQQSSRHPSAWLSNCKVSPGTLANSTDGAATVNVGQHLCLQAARAEVSQMVNSQKAAKQSELDKQYNDAKLRITREVESSIAALEKESQVRRGGEHCQDKVHS